MRKLAVYLMCNGIDESSKTKEKARRHAAPGKGGDPIGSDGAAGAPRIAPREPAADRDGTRETHYPATPAAACRSIETPGFRAPGVIQRRRIVCSAAVVRAYTGARAPRLKFASAVPVLFAALSLMTGATIGAQLDVRAAEAYAARQRAGWGECLDVLGAAVVVARQANDTTDGCMGELRRRGEACACWTPDP